VGLRLSAKPTYVGERGDSAIHINERGNGRKGRRKDETTR
jgi:hypothetical protein